MAMPSRKKIADYWMKTENGLMLPDDPSEHCWACQVDSDIERCHIIPASLGGRNIPENLVLLCSLCHLEGPNVDDSEFMWFYIRYTKMFGKGRYKIAFDMAEFATGLTHDEIAMKNMMGKGSNPLQDRIESLSKRTALHFGTALDTPATMAWMLVQGVYDKDMG